MADQHRGTHEPIQPDPAKNVLNETPDLQEFARFLENGDLPTPSPSPGTSLSSVPLTQPQVETQGASSATHTENQETESQAQSAPSPWSLHGLLRKASATLENTIETARREVAQNETLVSAQERVLASAQVTLSGFSAAFASPVNSTSPTQSATVMREDEATSSAPYASRTSTIRTLRVSHASSTDPLLMFKAGAASDLFVVTEHSIEAFDRTSAKILQANMNEARAAATDSTDGVTDTESAPRRSPVRATRAHARAGPDAARAVCAVHMAANEQVLVAHEDNVLRIYSLQSGRMGVLLQSSAALSVEVTCVELAPGTPQRLLVGSRNGIVSLMLASDLSTLAWLHPPEACETVLGIGSTSAPVSTVVGIAGNFHSSVMPDAPASGLVAVGYGDGTVVVNRFDDPQLGVPFSAHAGSLNGLVSFFDGAIIVSIGSEEDCSLAGTVAESGCCLVRRILPYVPSSICRVTPAQCAERDAKWVCPSESCFIVGGEEGQIDIFRLVPLSLRKLELRLVRRISEKTRGRRRAVLQTAYMPEDAILLALVQSGEVRRWHLNREDAFEMAAPEEHLSSARYNANNVVKALMSGADDGTGTRLAVGEGVITAQRVLAMVQEEDAGLDEAGKDLVVEEFQKKQSEMQEKASQVDSELRRAKLRISRRFAKSVDDVPVTASHCTKAINAAARRAAAVELNAVMQKHSQSLSSIRGEAVEQLRVVLLASLHGSRGDAKKIALIRQAANDLTKISVDAL